MKAWCKTHGIDPRLYQAWVNMRSRCYNSRHKSYPHYGRRGIIVCKRWDSFAAFAADMGPHPGKGWSLDRKRNNGNYRRGNCRWATTTMQNRNRQNNRLTTRSVADIRRRFKLGETRHALAVAYAMHYGVITQVINRRRW
jgi:hypothetical protein